MQELKNVRGHQVVIVPGTKVVLHLLLLVVWGGPSWRAELKQVGSSDPRRGMVCLAACICWVNGAVVEHRGVQE